MKYLFDEDNWDLTGYSLEIEKLLPRFDDKTAKFLREDSFHDGKILDIQIINKANGKRKNPTTIKMHIKHWNGKVYEVRWKQVHKFLIDFDITRNVYSNKPHKIVFGGKFGLHEWGYDELLPFSDKKIQHEIHLHSRAILNIYCSAIKIKRVKN
jgi:hypothetical protein